MSQEPRGLPEDRRLRRPATSDDGPRFNSPGRSSASGHPLGPNGAKLIVQISNEIYRRNTRHGMVTTCVGVGQGAVEGLPRGPQRDGDDGLIDGQE